MWSHTHQVASKVLLRGLVVALNLFPLLENWGNLKAERPRYSLGCKKPRLAEHQLQTLVWVCAVLANASRHPSLPTWCRGICGRVRVWSLSWIGWALSKTAWWTVERKTAGKSQSAERPHGFSLAISQEALSTFHLILYFESLRTLSAHKKKKKFPCLSHSFFCMRVSEG